MNKYTIEVSRINPMETAPLWDYYDGSVEVVCLFYKDSFDNIHSVLGYYDRDSESWTDSYTGWCMVEDLIGWLPNYTYVSTN